MTTFANLINNNPIYAKRAEADQSGVNIEQNYAKTSGSYSDMSVGSATTATNYASGGGIDSALGGKYTKPSTGIPKTDLASAVQTSLDKADSALQSHQPVTDNNPTLAWGATSKVGTVGSTDLRVTMPANPAQNLSASVITSGTFSTDRIANYAITADKVKDGETLPVNVDGSASRINNPIGSAPVTSGAKTYQLIARFRSDAYSRFSLKLMIGGETGRACSILFITVERNTYSAGLPVIAVSKVGNRSYAGGTQYSLEYTFDSDTNYLYLYGVTYAGTPMNPILLDDTSKTPTLMKLYSRTDTITAPSNTTSLTINVPVIAPLDTQVGSPTTPVYVKSDGTVDICQPSSMTVGHASALVPGGTSGQVLMSAGPGSDPSWTSIANAVWTVFQNIPSSRENAIPIATFNTWCSVLAYIDSNASLRLTIYQNEMDNVHTVTVSYSTGIQTSPALSFNTTWDIPVTFSNGVGQFHKIRLMEGNKILDLEVQFNSTGTGILYVRK